MTEDARYERTHAHAGAQAEPVGCLVIPYFCLNLITRTKTVLPQSNFRCRLVTPTAEPFSNMPSQNKRINLTIPPPLHTTIKRYSELLQKPEATVIRELLVEMQPMMESVIGTFEKTEVTREQVLDELQRTYMVTLAKGTEQVVREMDLLRDSE